MRAPNKWMLLAIGLLVLALLAWGIGKLRGPVLPGYEVRAGPMVQTVVATGRVVSVSRSQVGSEITGVVLERRVEEGDSVAPGDVLAVLRAHDLAAQVREAEAEFDNLVRSTRPQAEESLREAEARLAQAERETARRRDLFERELIAREALERGAQLRRARASDGQHERGGGPRFRGRTHGHPRALERDRPRHPWPSPCWPL